MKKAPVFLLAASGLAISLIAVLLVVLPVCAKPSSTSYISTWTDDFNSATLDSRWSWVREDAANWSLTAHPGFMRIITQGGNLTFNRNDQENLLLTSVNPGDFRITTRLNFTPTQNCHQAGLIVYQDDDNYVKFHRVYDSGHWVGFLYEYAGTPGVFGAPVTASTVLLQITRVGDAYSASYSLEDSLWNPVGVYTITLANPRVGLEVSDDFASTSIPADFDFFTLEDNSGYQVFLPVLIR